MHAYWLWKGELNSKTCDLIIEKSYQFEPQQAAILNSENQVDNTKPKVRISDIRWVKKDNFLSSLVQEYFPQANGEFGVNATTV